MRNATSLLLLLTAAGMCSLLQLAAAGQVPGPANAADIPITSRDRVYASDQSTNSVSVIDPATSKLLGVIKLGGRLQETLSALYKQQSLVHGMGFAPDHKTLAVVCVGSNAVVFIDTATNTVKHVAYVGRSPHEAMWTPDGAEIWVAIRGEDYIQVLDGKNYKPLRQVKVPAGPGMTTFSPNGMYAFICSSFTAETVVVAVKTHEIVARIKQESPFCPNIAATPDGQQVWMTLKDTGKIQVFSALPPFKQIAITQNPSPITNHVNFAVTPTGGQRAYVTVGGTHEVHVYSTGAQPKLLTKIKLTGDNPHGLWPSGDGSRLYVGLQLSNAVAVIDTSSNKVIDTIDIGGQAPMALMYVPQAVPAAAAASDPAANLEKPEAARAAAKAYHIELVAPGKPGDVQSSIALNSQGLVDSLEGAVTGLVPGQRYVLALAAKPDGGSSADLEPLAAFKAGKDGAASVTSIGPYSRLLYGSSKAATAAQQQKRYLVIALLDANENVGSTVQMQQL